MFQRYLEFQAEFTIPASLLGSNICLDSLVKKNQNDPIRTEGGIALHRNLELVELRVFQEEF